MTTISVIIPCYNQEAYIGECLDSVLAQTFTDWEAIVINDGSQDGSLDIIKQYLQKDSRIKLVDQVNQGVVVARNNALLQSEGKYIYPLDGDDKIAPRCLELLHEAMIQGKGDVVYSETQFFGLNDFHFELQLPSKVSMAVCNSVVCSALFKKSDALKYGGYDENMERGIEDWEFWCNFIYDDKKFYRLPEVLFYYRSTENGRNSCARSPYMIELTKYLRNKHLGRNVGVHSSALDDCGSVFSTFALYQYIELLGYKPYLVDYQHKYSKKVSEEIANCKSKYFKRICSCSKPSDLQDLNTLLPTLLISHSSAFDPVHIPHTHFAYFFKFAADRNKKIAYAASFGQISLEASKGKIEEMGDYLSRFNDIGVKEDWDKDICRDVFKLKSTRVLDSVFLLSADEWKEVSSCKELEAGVSLCIDHDDLRAELEDRLSHSRIISPSSNVDEYLSMLQASSFVLTDSYYAVCFCLIFKIQFLYISTAHHQSESVYSLFRLLELPKSLYINSNCVDKVDTAMQVMIDYDKVSEALSAHIDSSKQFLARALERENERQYCHSYFRERRLMHQIDSLEFALYSGEPKKSLLRKWRYRILSKITFGKTRKKYKHKYREYRKRR